MATNVRIRSGDRAPIPSARKTPCLVGTCELGEPGSVHGFDPGDDVVGTLGAGKLSAAVLYLHAATGARVVAAPAEPTYAALPSVIHKDANGNSPTGPAISIALTGAAGPFDDATLTVRLTRAGALGAAQGEIAYDGANFVESFVLPPPRPAVLRGSVNISDGADLEGLTLIWTVPAAKTLTFGAGSLEGDDDALQTALATTAADQVVTISAQPAVLELSARRVLFTVGGADPTHGPTSADIEGLGPAGEEQTETVALTAAAGVYKSTKLWSHVTQYTLKGATDTDATVAAGYSSRFADADEIAAAVNALAEAAPLAMRGRIADAADGIFPELYSLDAGDGVTATIDAASTAVAALGFSNLSATGSAATRVFPRLGVTVSFAAGEYAEGETYAWPLIGPRASVAALTAAATAAHDEFDGHPFGFLATVEDFAMNATAATALETLEDLLATWRADPDAPIFVDLICGTAFHVASAVRATNNTAIAAFDADLVAEFGTVPANLENVAVDDCYVAGSASLLPGTFRRSASWAGAAKRASAEKIAANPGDGLVPGATLVGPDGRTLARNDATATTKLGGLNGPGFWALKGTRGANGLANPKFGVCATRAGATSRLRDPGAVAVALEIATIVSGEVEFYEGQTWETQADNPLAAAPEETDTRADHLRAVLADVLTPSSDAPRNVSGFDVTIAAPTVLNDGTAAVAVPFNPLAPVGTVNVAITATGARITPAAA